MKIQERLVNNMRKFFILALSMLILTAAGCAPSAGSTTPAATTAAATASAAADATAAALPMDQAIARYIKTDNGKSYVNVDNLKADFDAYQIVSSDNGFDLKTITADKAANMLDLLAKTPMTSMSLNTAESATDVWNVQAYTNKYGKLDGNSFTIKASTDTQMDIYIVEGSNTQRLVFSVSDADGAALRAMAKQKYE